ncbi:TIGR04104 family putative zinc finger protein [Virgibacillus xinjiangensis]|uniref:TIGR04104 family putative zinc finger protein n=1 Tax=Virgibacillus xinjiangensis TaxID=393090 RepID=A0ABV7CWX7_9BACI
MQTCEKCGEPFSWKEIYQSFWLNYKPITCANCGTVHHVTTRGRVLFTSLSILPMMVVGFIFTSFSSFLATLGIALAVAIAGSSIAPFFVTYEEETS